MINLDDLKSYKLINANGLSVTVTNFGGKIMSLMVPDRMGEMADIVHGYDTPQQYLNGNPYFGALIGRYGNRIAKGKFSIENISYQLNINNGNNALHGGPNGFHNKIWNCEQIDSNSLELKLHSRDGEEGYPGHLIVVVRYALSDDNELVIDYVASTTKTTIVNLTNHAFFNLAATGDILNHELRINGDYVVPVNNELIPIGGLQSVDNTPFDFKEVHTIGERIAEMDRQLQNGHGYDHTYVLNKKANVLDFAAWVREPLSGWILEVWTTEPGLQFYSGNFLDGKELGKRGNNYPFRSAFCLEAQHFPDSPNQPDFPTTLLHPGETYKQKTVYKFGVD